jgi:long-chain fatty acid transport protein
MKKLVIVVFAVGLIFSGASLLFAGGIDNKQNFSAEYIRTFSRNAATDAADVTVYNPAGVMKMENGVYVNLGIFHALKDYSNTIGGTEYDSDAPSTIPGPL